MAESGFWVGLIIGIIVMLVGMYFDDKIRENKEEDQDENDHRFEFRFPNGSSQIKQVGTGYFTYIFDGKKILVFKPGTSEMSMTILEEIKGNLYHE